jgi:glycosyltransferase involved in cell wall biosynthesis
LRRFREFLRREQPALVHANSLYTLAEGIVARRSGAKLLLHLHEMAPAGWKGTAGRRLAWRTANQVVSVSRSSAADMSWRGQMPRIVHEAAPVPEHPVEIRERPEPFVVGSVGVLSQRKGTDLFVGAAEQLRREGSELDFRLIGAVSDGPDAEWAAQQLRRAEAAGIGHLPRADVFAELRDWDCFVLPSRADPFPIALLEAMASGLPVIGTRVDGIAEEIAPGTGTLVDGDDPGALAGAIRQVASMDAAQRRAIGSAARDRVVENFTIEHQARALDDAYAAALA